jgi:GAF domain-containing protein
LEGTAGVAAVLALYRAGQDAFTADDLGVVEATTAGVGIAIENAGRLKASATSAGSA